MAYQPRLTKRASAQVESAGDCKWLCSRCTFINLANAGMVPSGGWVNTTLGGLNDDVWGTPGSVYVPSMASTLQWA